ncbi:hypothetical protein CCM_07027 [Cordyceps militaris CM01]|uniref:Uncharacterized protein n=1 Tax=Cordyceps militaris (strain CM01) TaxID=983644 RepID=G3JLN3_CORMM|nr:uncharacterized protein CCM_07027 [Cordyceps militaris CM01]EGX90607.1 hypothetical protein CCM_07027 [Cordyceps militaris CM01]
MPCRSPGIGAVTIPDYRNRNTSQAALPGSGLGTVRNLAASLRQFDSIFLVKKFAQPITTEGKLPTHDTHDQTDQTRTKQPQCEGSGTFFTPSWSLNMRLALQQKSHENRDRMLGATSCMGGRRRWMQCYSPTCLFLPSLLVQFGRLDLPA